MKNRSLSILALVLVAQGCGVSSASGPFEESTDRCKNWSSLRCEGIPSKSFLREHAKKSEGLKYNGQSAASIERTSISDFLGRRANNYERIRYLNGWDNDIGLETEIELNESETIWIATGGFLPEEFPKYKDEYSFAEEDCAAQIRDGERNGVKCVFMSAGWGWRSVNEFLRNIGNRISLEEFIEMNGLPSDTTMSSRIFDNRFYKTGKSK